MCFLLYIAVNNECHVDYLRLPKVETIYGEQFVRPQTVLEKMSYKRRKGNKGNSDFKELKVEGRNSGS